MDKPCMLLKTTGSNIASWTVVYLKNRQADPPWINRGTPKK